MIIRCCSSKPPMMVLFWILCVWGSQSLLSGVFAYSKILDGETTPIENVPYQLALYRYNSYISGCGATIIHEYAALTAAHCVIGLNIDDVTFSAGSNFNNRSGSIHRADWIVVHYNYDWATLQNDIAFVKVVEPFVFGDQIKAAALPTAAPQSGIPALSSGWGDSRDSVLSSVAVPIVSLVQCQTKYSKFELLPSADMLCAGSDDSITQGPCDGDAGGPLVVQGTVVGVFTWSAGCGVPDYPYVFANVFHFREFIDENLSYIRQ